MAYALITGASKGIGRAIAHELAKKGFHLLLVARSNELLLQASEELSSKHKVDVAYLSVDLSQKGAAHQVADWCLSKSPDLSILVNNAGYGLSGDLQRYPLQEHLDMMQVNMSVVVELSYLLLPQLRKQPQAYLLNIASSAAYQAVPYLGIYAASKAFVVNFSRSLRFELRNSSVSVTCISPGATDTAFTTRAGVGAKALKASAKLNMKAEAVAALAVNAMFEKKAETITGFINKLGAFFVWLLPKNLVEKTAAQIYE